MATGTVSQTINLIDSAIGPLAVRVTILTGYDIDDLTHDMTRAQAITLQIKNAAAVVNPTLAANRPPINIEEAQVGGY